MYLFGTGKKCKSWNSTNFMMTIFQEISKENSKLSGDTACCAVRFSGLQKAYKKHKHNKKCL